MNLELVRAELKYWPFILTLRNLYKEYFINQDPISWMDHYSFMQSKDCHYRVCLYDGDPVGFIGSVNNDIRFAVSPEFKGKGVGVFMLNEIIKIYPDAYGKVKVDNEASLKAFEKAGFKKKYYILEK